MRYDFPFSIADTVLVLNSSFNAFPFDFLIQMQIFSLLFSSLLYFHIWQNVFVSCHSCAQRTRCSILILIPKYFSLGSLQFKKIQKKKISIPISVQWINLSVAKKSSIKTKKNTITNTISHMIINFLVVDAIESMKWPFVCNRSMRLRVTSSKWPISMLENWQFSKCTSCIYLATFSQNTHNKTIDEKIELSGKKHSWDIK